MITSNVYKPFWGILAMQWNENEMKWNEMKWNESGFRPPLCTYRLNWARRTSWGWWDDWDDTALQTQDSKYEPWRSEAEHATSRSRRLPTILTFTRDREPNPELWREACFSNSNLSPKSFSGGGGYLGQFHLNNVSDIHRVAAPYLLL